MGVWRRFMRIVRLWMGGESLVWTRHTLFSFHARLGDSKATKKRSWMPNSACFACLKEQRSEGVAPVKISPRRQQPLEELPPFVYGGDRCPDAPRHLRELIIGQGGQPLDWPVS